MMLPRISADSQNCYGANLAGVREGQLLAKHAVDLE
jgi:hypothetical protein